MIAEWMSDLEMASDDSVVRTLIGPAMFKLFVDIFGEPPLLRSGFTQRKRGEFVKVINDVKWFFVRNSIAGDIRAAETRRERHHIRSPKNGNGLEDCVRLSSTAFGIGTTAYMCNDCNRLTSLSGPGGTETYAYNGVDSRVSRTAGGVATSFKRAGAGQTSPVLSEIQGSSTSVRYMPGIYEDRGGTVTNYHSGIKNTFLQTNAAGSQTAAKRYDALGNVLASSGTWQGRFAYGGPHGYQTDASLQLLGDRYYDPTLGRFLTRDIAKDGRNWYVYCGNNPLKYADPEGTGILHAAARIRHTFSSPRKSRGRSSVG